jgi:branched-chain amino acid transport system permease protein
MLSLFFRFTMTGLALRATALNRQVALSMGISVRWMFALAWAIAAIVSAVGGVLLGSIRGGIDMSLGHMGLKVLPVVILGGLDSLPGAIVGGIVIGVLENITGGYLDPILGGGVKEVVPPVVLVLILMLRPSGLFGTRKVDRV